MPIYEFKCEGCGAEYEELVSLSAKGDPPCPACRSENVDRKMSVFGSIGGSASGSGASCGKSGFS